MSGLRGSELKGYIYMCVCVVVERGLAGRAGAMRVIASCWGNARHRPKHAATRLHPAGPPEAHAECFLPHAPAVQTRPVFLPQAPTVQTCVSGGAPAAKLRPTTRTRRRLPRADREHSSETIFAEFLRRF